MKPKLIALNLALLAALGAIAWQANVRLREARAERRDTIDLAVKPIVAPPLAPAPKPEPAQPVKYADVATKNLFSKDRNPTVIIDPPKVEPSKPKPMPPLPVVYGVLGLPSGTRAIMAEKSNGESRPVQAGDTVGEFRIVSLDTKDVVFDWDGQQLSRKIDDLIDRSGPARAGGAQGPAVQPAAPAAPPAPAAAAPRPAVAAGPAKSTAPDRPCAAGDNSPMGTVVDGYRKDGYDSPFGKMGCRWVAVQ